MKQSTNTSKLTSIMGKSVLTASKMNGYLRSINPKAPLLADLYLAEGLREGVRGDLAFCQSIIETGNFTFKGSAVKLSQNNFSGLGVTSNGMTGNSFPTAQIGIRAQIQHLKAYATSEPLKMSCVDVRYRYVKKGCAPYIEWLGQKENPNGYGWAAGADYGKKILDVYKRIQNFKVSSTSTEDQKIANHRILMVKQTQNWINSYAGLDLKIDGIPGPLTYSGLDTALKKYINETFGAKLCIANKNSSITTSVKAYFRKMTVKLGVEAPYVMILKMYFLFDGFVPDDLSGVCDSKFSKQIKDFQKQNKLAVDGVAGYNTWNKTVTS